MRESLCIQYSRTGDKKWRVTIHNLQPEPVVSTALLDSLPFPEPQFPLRPGLTDPLIPLYRSKKVREKAEPYTWQDLKDEELIIKVMREEGFSPEETNAALRLRRENILAQKEKERERQ